MVGGEWDCLVRSGGGRFLWLRLEFRGNGKVTPRLDSIEIEFPRISLRRYLPAVFGKEAVSADFTDRFLSLFDTTFRSIETKLDREARYFDPLSAPAERDPKPARIFSPGWHRGLVSFSIATGPRPNAESFSSTPGACMHCAARAEGLWRELLLFLDMDETTCCRADQPRDRCQPRPANCAPPKPAECGWRPPPLILEHFKLRRWLFLGAGRLGDQAVLWGKRIVNRSQLDDTARADRTQLLTAQDPLRDPFHVYAYKFSVFVPASFPRIGYRPQGAGKYSAQRPAGGDPGAARIRRAALSHRLSIDDRFRQRRRPLSGGRNFERYAARPRHGIDGAAAQTGRTVSGNRRTVTHRNDNAIGIEVTIREISARFD